MTNPTKIVFALACASSSIDQQTNAVSVFNIFEDIGFEITVEKKTEEITLPFQFDVMTLFARSDTAQVESDIPFWAKISLVDPDGKILADTPFEGVIEKAKKRMRMTIKFNGIKLTRTGTYLFKVLLLKEKDKEDVVQTFEFPLDITVNVTVKN